MLGVQGSHGLFVLGLHRLADVPINYRESVLAILQSVTPAEQFFLEPLVVWPDSRRPVVPLGAMMPTQW